MNDHEHPILDDYGEKIHPKNDDKKHPILDDYGRINSHPEIIDDKKHPILDANCIK